MKENQFRFPHSSSEAVAARLNQQIQISITIAMIIGCFLLFWLPFILVTAHQAFFPAKSILKDNFHRSLDPEVLDQVVSSFTFYLTIMNSALDPIIFIWRTPKMKSAVVSRYF
jgi:7 transmembrane receptor (rhodopsin family)